jgi:hypothetical protein
MSARDFILDPYSYRNFSPAMRAVSDHAAEWLMTVDGLSSSSQACDTRTMLTRKTAARAADLGFRGDSVRRAYRFLADQKARP